STPGAGSPSKASPTSSCPSSATPTSASLPPLPDCPPPFAPAPSHPGRVRLCRSHEDHRPHRRHELGIDRPLLCHPQSGDRPAARRPALGAPHHPLGRLRPDRKAAARRPVG